ncbi:MAG: outer membrane protein assembly factor BamA [Phycisphaerales bacterium]|nr:MAG: outer membrane protein assembly factor BamA [Phycisphaerales bacterium]
MSDATTIRTRVRFPRHLLDGGFRAAWLIGLALSVFVISTVHAQPIRGDQADLVDRPISDLVIDGLERVERRLVENNLRASIGDPYDPATVRNDVNRLYQLGRFSRVTAEAELLNDGTVRVIYRVEEQQLIAEIQVVGNSLISDQEIRSIVPLFPGGPRDDYLIETAVLNIEDIYRRRGHYLTSVDVDRAELEESGLLIFRVIEGPRTRIRAIEFEGNEAFTDDQLQSQIETRTALVLLRRGELDEERLIDDVAALNRYYRDRGYLAVRVDRRIELSPDSREAKVVFVVDEGDPYTLRSVRAERRRDGAPLEIFTHEQIQAMIEIKPGDVYRGDLLRRSIEVIQDAYGRLGRVDVRIDREDLMTADGRQVDLLLVIDEGQRATTGMVNIQGNFLTKDKVIRRQVRLQPGRPLDSTEIARSTRRLRDTRLFNDVRITVQEPRDEDEEVRDVLVEIKERNTGSLGFGLAVGSDAGLFGEISLSQDNFDIADWPETWGEMFRGRAFRGAGQRFNMTLRPGNELFQYSASITEPNLFETDYSLRVSGSFLQRQFRRYDEERISGTVALGRQFGDVWSGQIRTRFDRVRLSRISSIAPTAIFDDAGPDLLTTAGLSLTRTTITTITRPGRGSRFSVGYDRVGALGGDFQFNRVTGDYTVFFTLDEDFLGRKSTLRLNTDVGYIFGGDSPPTYERFYRGGRTFRGFRFREISPKGIRADNNEPSDDPVGGTWMFFAGAQYEFPIFGEAITGVFFVDSGTVTDSVGFDDYRVSLGTGLRLYIPQFGPVPIAFDFAVPVKKQDEDETQVLSFSAELPF